MERDLCILVFVCKSHDLLEDLCMGILLGVWSNEGCGLIEGVI